MGKKATTSRQLHDAVQERQHWLKKREVWGRMHRRMLMHAYRQLKQQRHTVEKRFNEMRVQGGRNYKNMISHARAYKRAAVHVSHRVLELRHVWSTLHTALQICKKKIAENSRLAKSWQEKTAKPLEQ